MSKICHLCKKDIVLIRDTHDSEEFYIHINISDCKGLENNKNIRLKEKVGEVIKKCQMLISVSDISQMSDTVHKICLVDGVKALEEMCEEIRGGL